VSYSDPYGLKVCFEGSASEITELKTATEGATGASIELDKDGCISSVGAATEGSTRGLRDRLEFLNNREDRYTVGLAFTASDFDSQCDNVGSHFCQIDLTVTIDQTEVWGRRDPASYPLCGWFGKFGSKVGHSGETIIAHELLGHAWAYATGQDIYDESIAIAAENVFRGRGPEGRLRCN
jgi:hypothetical protein